MSSLDLSSNRIGGYYTHYRSDGSGYGGYTATSEGRKALTDAIRDMRAMTTLILKDNRLLNKESGTALGNMLKSNTVLTKLDVSDNAYDSDEDDGPGFAQELAIGIKDNGALIMLDISSNRIGTEQERDLQRICVAGGIELAK
jgi:hypothetical protein